MASIVGSPVNGALVAGTITLTVPTVAVNTVLIAMVGAYGVAAATIAVPSGWARVGVQYSDIDAGSDSIHITILSKIVANGDPTSVTFTGTSITAIAAVIQGYSVQIPATSSAGKSETTSASAHTAAAVTVTTTSDVVISGFVTYYGSTHAWTAGSGYVSRGNPIVGDDISLIMEDRLSGATGSVTPTATGAKATSAIAMISAVFSDAAVVAAAIRVRRVGKRIY